MNEKLINALIQMSGSKEAVEEAFSEPIATFTKQMRAAVVAGKSIEAARFEGMISALESAYKHFEKFAANYRVHH